jgi:hypothetical protein
MYLKLLVLSISMSWWHAHGVVLRWWGGRAVWCASWSGVVLRAAPGETNTRVTNRIALHLVDGHLSSMTLDELNETTTLSWWDLNIGDLAKALGICQLEILRT